MNYETRGLCIKILKAVHQQSYDGVKQYALGEIGMSEEEAKRMFCTGHEGCKCCLCDNTHFGGECENCE